MNYYIMTTKEESDTCRAECYAEHIKDHTGGPEYIAGTLRWSEEQVRLDGKYIVPVCSHYSNPNNYPIEASEPHWFPQEII